MDLKVNMDYYIHDNTSYFLKDLKRIDGDFREQSR